MGQNITTKTTLRNGKGRKGDGKKRLHVHCMFLLTSNMLNTFLTRQICPGLSSIQFPEFWKFAPFLVQRNRLKSPTAIYISRKHFVIRALEATDMGLLCFLRVTCRYISYGSIFRVQRVWYWDCFLANREVINLFHWFWKNNISQDVLLPK